MLYLLAKEPHNNTISVFSIHYLHFLHQRFDYLQPIFKPPSGFLFLKLFQWIDIPFLLPNIDTVSFILISEVCVPIKTVTFSTFFAFLTSTFCRFLLVYNRRGEHSFYIVFQLTQLFQIQRLDMFKNELVQHYQLCYQVSEVKSRRKLVQMVQQVQQIYIYLTPQVRHSRDIYYIYIDHAWERNLDQSIQTYI